ncbi:hypothetical protein BH10PLA1_BH10PLA1_12520 [soil metagenome]
MTLARPWIRTLAYTLLAMAAASATIFSGLSADRIYGDEATYALCVDTMVDTGQWMSPAPYPNAHYFQKPPLQMWLTAATYHHLPDIIRYRAWPAAFGVLSVGLTCLLAAAMFAPEVGLLAGLLLATNNRFIFEHGARAGTFDSGLTFLILLGTAIYWGTTRRGITLSPGTAGKGGDQGSVTTAELLASESQTLSLPTPGETGEGQIEAITPSTPRRGRGFLFVLAWIALGVVIGLAGLLKPLAGLPLLALLAVHVFTLPRIQWRRQWITLAWTLGVSMLVMLPWYIVQFAHFGSDFLRDIFARNIVERITVGVDPRHSRAAFYYAIQISRTATAFNLAIPAMLFAVVAALRGPPRMAWRLISVVAIGWVFLFSLSHSKAPHYIYPALPTISIAIAGLLAWVIQRVGGLFKSDEFRQRALVTGYTGLSLAMLFNAVWFAGSHFNERGKRYEPYELYKAFEPAIRSGAARFVVAGFEGNDPIWYGREGLEVTDLFYVRRMPAVNGIDAKTLQAKLGNREPTLLFVARSLAKAELPEASRIDRRFGLEMPGYTVYGVDLDSITRLPLDVSDGDFADQAHLQAAVVLRGAGLLKIRATLAEPVAPPLLCKVFVDGMPVSESSMVVDGPIVSLAVPITSKLLSPGMRRFDLSFRPLSGNAAVRGRLDFAELTIDPLDRNRGF